MTIGAYDSLTNTIVYHKHLASEYGVSGSLVHGTGIYDYLYVGANVEASATKRWWLALLRIDH